MQPATWMTSPSWFLVTGLEWPEDQADAEVAEAAFAIAPYVTGALRPIAADGKPVPLGHDLALMLDVGSRCAAALGKRVVFLSDTTRWLADIGLSWERTGVDFPAAQAELEHQSIGMYLSVPQRAYAILCSTANALTVPDPTGGLAESSLEERELVRANFQAALDSDWPSYVTEALARVQPAA